MQAGLDSLGAVEVGNLLSNSLNLNLPSTLLFDFPTIASLEEYLFARVAATCPSSRHAGDEEVKAGHGKHQLALSATHATAMPAACPTSKVAVGGHRPSPVFAIEQLAARSPGQGAELALLHGKGGGVIDPLGLVPLERWDVEAIPANSLTAR